MQTKIKIDEETWTKLRAELLSRTDVESAAVLLAEPLAGADSTVLVVRSARALPEEAYAIREIDRLRIDPIWLNRLVRPARERGWSILTMHTHPGTSEPWFSAADDDGDGRLMPALAVQVPDVPHGSLVLAGTGRVVARTFHQGSVRAADVVSVGKTITSLTSSAYEHTPEATWHDRQRLALGDHGQRSLANLRVGLVGAGGTGSVVGVQLAHLGVGEIIPIDADIVEATNLSRILGATLDDVGVTPKVEVLARYITRIGLPVRVRPIAKALDHRTAPVLQGVDVIVSCVDRHVPRAVLNRLAYQACIPVVDLGTAFRVDDTGRIVGDAGRVVVVGPGRPCLGCWGHIDPDALRRETLSSQDAAELIERGYIDGADVPQPSVIAFNTMVAGAGVIELLRLITHFSGCDTPPLRLAFSFEQGTVRRNTIPRQPCSICGDYAPASFAMTSAV